ncbi:MAG: hypothetical protein NC177_09345 [Ruminococcus flavefaciens]|nr:hypothetical protein [Ruminococcus flavefaciens]
MGLNIKHKPERYRVRDEIEETIKEENIDRSKFHEVSKFSYENILQKFYYTFFEYDRNLGYSEPKKIDLSYAWLNFRKSLNYSGTIRLYYDERDIDSVKKLVPDYSDDKICFGIVEDGWVYEGEISAMLTAFSEIYFKTDFYIISKKFDWVVVNCEDGECLWRMDSEKH